MSDKVSFLGRYDLRMCVLRACVLKSVSRGGVSSGLVYPEEVGSVGVRGCVLRGFALSVHDS